MRENFSRLSKYLMIYLDAIEEKVSYMLSLFHSDPISLNKYFGYIDVFIMTVNFIVRLLGSHQRIRKNFD